jgi:hypothetical protein
VKSINQPNIRNIGIWAHLKPLFEVKYLILLMAHSDFLMEWTISSSTMRIYYILLKQYFTFLAYHWLLLSFIRDMPLIPFTMAMEKGQTMICKNTTH